MSSVIIMLPVLAGMFVIPILIGVYVYRDAARRGMNAALWTLIALLAPTFIGLIIYLLVRSNYSDLTCPACAERVTEQYVVCPKCGTKLKASCAGCGFPTEPGWTVCPRCAVPLPEQGGGHITPVQKKDSALGKILLLVILLPILLIVLIGIFSFLNSGSYSMNTINNLKTEDYADRPEITEWIEKCREDTTKIYALCYKTERGGQQATHYLVYHPKEVVIDSWNVGRGSSLFGPRIEVELFEGGSPVGEDTEFICVSTYSDKHVGLKVSVNGRKVDCEITEVDYALAPFELLSEEIVAEENRQAIQEEKAG